jgi:hypothetical protein
MTIVITMVIIHDHGQVTFELMTTLSQLFIAVDIWLTNVQPWIILLTMFSTLL